GEHRAHAEHRSAGRRLAIESLLEEEEADASRAHVLDELREVQHRAAEPVDGPCRDDIEPAGDGVLTEPVESGALVAALGTGHAVVGVELDDSPAALLRRSRELPALILDGLRA